MSLKWENLVTSLEAGAAYIPVTLKMTAIVFSVSLVIGLLVATVRFYRVPVISQILTVFSTVYLGIPMILAINVYYLLYYTLYPKFIAVFRPDLSIRDINFTGVAYFTLILGTSIFLGETFRGAYEAIEKLQFEAAGSIGLTTLQSLRYVILPQIVPVVLPNLLNMLTGTLKNMSFIYIIGLYEIMQGSLVPCVQTYSYVEGYIAAALIYWALVFVIERFGKLAEKYSVRYRRQPV